MSGNFGLSGLGLEFRNLEEASALFAQVTEAKHEGHPTHGLEIETAILSLVARNAQGNIVPEFNAYGVLSSAAVVRPGDMASGAQIEALLSAYAERTGFTKISESGRVVRLEGEEGEFKDVIVSLEPRGQVELSLPKGVNVHEIIGQRDKLLGILVDVAREQDLGVFSIGLHPLKKFSPEADLQHILRKRHRDMAEAIFALIGEDGLAAMCGTVAAQDNILVKRARFGKTHRVALYLQAVGIAALANSQVFHGEILDKLRSKRAKIWFDAWGKKEGQENWSLGLYREMFKEGYSPKEFFLYVAHNLPVFVWGGDTLAEHAQKNGGKVTTQDMEMALGSLFDEVKPKFICDEILRDVAFVLENRGPDGVPLDLSAAWSALTAGLLGDERIVDKIDQMLRTEGQDTFINFIVDAPSLDLEAPTAYGKSVRVLLRGLLADAAGGLSRRGMDEVSLLQPLVAIAAGFRNTPGQEFVDAINSKGGGPEAVRRILLEKAQIRVNVPGKTLAPPANAQPARLTSVCFG